MNPSRVSNADIDTDYCGKDRDKIKYFLLHDKMNLPNIKTAEIITFNTIAMKGAIKDVCRALGIDLATAQEISDAVELDDNKQWVIADSYKKKYPELFEYVDIVNGTIVSIGTHPSGVLVSDRNIDEIVGLCSIATSDYPVSMLDMHGLDGQMFVKLDILGLDNIGVINECCKLVGIDRLTPDNVNLNDEKVWRNIREDTTMIFQWESDSAQDYLKKFMSDKTLQVAKEHNKDFSYIKWFSFGNGLIRPGCASFRDNISNGEVLTTGFKELDEFLAITFGRVTMQEDIMRFCKQFCGYNDAESDNVRRCVDKNSLILMGDGSYKAIKDIKIGDYVISYNETTGKNEAKKVTNVFNNGIKPTLKLTTQYKKELILTPNHKLYTERGFKEAVQLDLNSNVVFTPTYITTLGDNKKPNQRLSQSDLYLIGMLLGDGTINNTGNGNVVVFTNHDTSLINKFKYCVNKHLINKKPAEFTIKEYDGKTVDKIYAISIKSPNYRKSIISLLDKYNLRQSAHNKKIPKEFMLYPRGAKLSNLLAGLFDTDGGVSCMNGTIIDYSSTSEDLIRGIHYALLKYGISSYYIKEKINNYDDYYSYRLFISHKKSINQFIDNIVPYMASDKGIKIVDLFNNKSDLSYNYILPKLCKNEIIEASKNDNGVSSIIKGWHIKYNTITDISARKLVPYYYLPITYKLLMSDLEPMKIKSLIEHGNSEVYDIEVEDNHNYYANDILVHNCIAKKKGTEGLLGELHDRFLQYSHDIYGVEKDKLEEIFPPIKQGILDASSYAFSWNHSDAYSCIGYISGYLRYYYPLEFLTAAFNTFTDKEEKITAITEYAKKINIHIKDIQFGHSKADYSCDKTTNIIYKGMESIKYMNAEVSNKLYEMSQTKHYDNFIDLLKEFPGDSRQLDLLINLNYFCDFGSPAKLLAITDIYTKYFGKKLIKKDTCPFEREEMLQFATETDKQYKITDPEGFINYMCENVPEREYTVQDRLNAESTYLGYCSYKSPALAHYAYVLSVDVKYTPKIEIYDIATGKKFLIKTYKKDYQQNPISVTDIISYGTTYKNKSRLDENKQWVKTDEKELFFSYYSVIKQKIKLRGDSNNG